MINKRKIYLAGGFNSGWQKVASASLKHFYLLDPSLHHLEDPVAYTEWDLAAIRECDIVLANMEATNPAGYAMSLEMGYAKALGKKVIFVDQITDPQISRHFGMIRQASDEVFPSLHSAIEFLNRSIENEMHP
jgi:nucleoside 2-deoxyribosyltransferase